MTTTVDARVVRTHRDVLAATLRVLAAEGWEAVTQARLAQVAGYSRATVYQHWPTRQALLRDAVQGLGPLPHVAPSGDLRADLLAELRMLRGAVRERRLDRVLAALVGLAASSTDLAAARDALVADLRAGLRALLADQRPGPGRDAAVELLCGVLVHPALVDGRLPDDDALTASVDLVLSGLDRPVVARLPDAAARTRATIALTRGCE